MRPSNPTLQAASRALFGQRERLVAEWSARLADRAAGSRTIPAELQARQVRLMIDVIAEMAGPLRREGAELWEKVCTHYGRTGAARGLLAGEVAEEFGALREILTRDLAGEVSALRGRQALAVLIHLNRVIDRGIGSAVAAYTDALVAELFARDGVPSEENALDAEELERVLAGLAGELVSLTTPPAEGNVTR